MSTVAVSVPSSLGSEPLDYKEEWARHSNDFFNAVIPVVETAVTQHDSLEEYKTQTMNAAFATAFTLATADGPLPFGDIAAVVVLTGVGLYLFFDD